MTIIHGSADCGNSPKNQFVENLTAAFITGDTQLILDRVTGDVRWTRAGQEVIEGKHALAAALDQLNHEKAAEATIHHVATHGKAGAVNGTARMENGKTREFCYVYEFGSAKATSVREITSYVIDSG